MEVIARETQLAALFDAIDRAAAGVGSTVLVEAPAGGGKTTLLAELIRRTTLRRVAITTAAGLDTPIPFGPVIDIGRTLDHHLERLAADNEPSALAERLLDLFDHRPPPTLVAIDDAHRIDQATAELLRWLIPRLEKHPGVLVLAGRSEPIDRTDGYRSLLADLPAGLVTRVEVPPFSVDEITRLAPTGVDPRRLEDETGGNPLLVTEAIRAGDSSPDLRRLVLARLDSLELAARDLITLLSVIPEGASGALLDRIEPGWELLLEPAEELGLLTLRDHIVAFRHELIRRIVHDDLTEMRRRFLHRRVLEALEPTADRAQLALHAAGAGDIDMLISTGPVAARDALRRSSFAEAARQYARVLTFEHSMEAGLRADLLSEYASALWALNDPTGSQDAIERAIACRSDGDDAGVGRDLTHLARCLWFDLEGEEARRTLEAAIDHLRRSGDLPGLAEAVAYRALQHGIRTSWEAARPFIEEARSILPRLGDGPAASVLNDVGTVESLYGHGEEGLVEARVRAERAGDSVEQVRVHANLAFTTAARSRHAEAQEAVTAGVHLAEARRVRAFDGVLSLVQAHVALARADWSDATDILTSIAEAVVDPGFGALTGELLETRLAVRSGSPTAPDAVEMAVSAALDNAEPERVLLAMATAAEDGWLRGTTPDLADLDAAFRLIEATGMDVWIDEMAWWCTAHGLEARPAGVSGWAMLAEGRFESAAVWFAQAGMRYEAVLAGSMLADPEALLVALGQADRIDAAPLATRIRRTLAEAGVERVPRGPNRATRRNEAGLTRRQADVAWLVTDGLTNTEIAERLFLSPRTVDHHVAAVLTKLGLSSRRQVADRLDELGVERPIRG